VLKYISKDTDNQYTVYKSCAKLMTFV